MGTGIYTPRHSGKMQPDVAILTSNPTIAPVRRSIWGLGLGLGLRIGQLGKFSCIGQPDDISLAQKM